MLIVVVLLIIMMMIQITNLSLKWNKDDTVVGVPIHLRVHIQYSC